MAKYKKGYNNKAFINKLLAVALAVILAAVLTAGVLCTGFASRDESGKWFGNSNLSTWHWSDNLGIAGNDSNTPDTPDTPDNSDNTDKDNSDNSDDTYGGNTASGGNSLITENENNGIALLSEVIPRVAFEANGISTQADSAYTLTATYSPAGATDLWDWTVTGNDDEGITLTVNGLSATVTCNKAFDVKKVITITSQTNASVKASCTVDYYKRLESVSVNAPTIKLNKGTTNATFSVVPKYGKGTILDTTVTISGVTMTTSFVDSQFGHAQSSNGSQADASGTVRSNNGTISLVMSPTEESSFYHLIKGVSAGMYEAYYKWFISCVNNYPSSSQYAASVTWYATRNGGTFDSATVNVYGGFDVSALAVNANGVTMGDTNILF